MRPLSPAEFRDGVEAALDALDEAQQSYTARGPSGCEYSYDPLMFELFALVQARIRTLLLSPEAQARRERAASYREAVGRVAAKLEGRHTLQPIVEATIDSRLRPLERPRPGDAAVYQIKATLRGSNPPIWRRIEVSARARLFDLHMILQVAFGWENRHLYLFDTPYGSFARPAPDEGDEVDDMTVTLEQIVAGEGSQIYVQLRLW